MSFLQRKRKTALIAFCIIALAICIYNFFYSPPIEDKIISLFKENSKTIHTFCQIYNLESRYYSSVVYSELINNWNYFDMVDEERAKLGFDPSIGFAQMRISTCVWIEEQYSDQYIMKSPTRDALIRKISNPDTSIIYSVYYIKMICERLKTHYADTSVVPVKTVASYYGRGIDYNKTVDTTYCNRMGISAEKFYYSDLLLEEFSRNYHNK